MVGVVRFDFDKILCSLEGIGGIAGWQAGWQRGKGEGGVLGCTFTHAQIRPYDQHQFTLLPVPLEHLQPALLFLFLSLFLFMPMPILTLTPLLILILVLAILNPLLPLQPRHELLVRRIRVDRDIVAVRPAWFFRFAGRGRRGGGGRGGFGFEGGGEETDGGGLAEEVTGAGGEDEGGEDVGGCGGKGAVGEGGHLGR